MTWAHILPFPFFNEKDNHIHKVMLPLLVITILKKFLLIETKEYLFFSQVISFAVEVLETITGTLIGIALSL